jgi:hypothetical protein
MKKTALLMILMLLTAQVSFVFAQTNKSSYGISTMVSKKGDTKEVNTELTFFEKNLVLKSDKDSSIIKDFNYADITGAEYSYSKKPMWKTALVTGIFVGVLAAPLLFIRKKSHWMTIKTNNDFAVLKLEGKNYKKIMLELETRKITVETIKEK